MRVYVYDICAFWIRVCVTSCTQCAFLIKCTCDLRTAGPDSVQRITAAHLRCTAGLLSVRASAVICAKHPDSARVSVALTRRCARWEIDKICAQTCIADIALLLGCTCCTRIWRAFLSRIERGMCNVYYQPSPSSTPHSVTYISYN